jgi:hypothetical protein
MPEILVTFAVKVPANIARKIRSAAKRTGVSPEATIGIGAVCHAYTALYGSDYTGAEEPEVIAITKANPKKR